MSDQVREVIANAGERLVSLGIDPNAAVYVDDENRLPSYARHLGTAWGGKELDDESWITHRVAASGGVPQR